MFDRQYRHPMFPQARHDDLARQHFVMNLQGYCFDTVRDGNRQVFEGVVRPAFKRTHGREPADRHEVRRAMEGQPFHQAWSSLRRIAQEMNWAAAQDGVDHQSDALIDRARETARRNRKKGSLRLDPRVKAPRYLTAVDIHVMPGNYHTEYEPDDVYQAAIFDRGSYVLNRGSRGPLHNSLGYDVLGHLKATHPDLRPTRILDMGCSIAASAIPVAQAFPEAEFHAIDVAAPFLRYGHARAESLGVAVHFSQQNMEHTDFDDESFDLVLSCLTLHETSSRALPEYMKETRRLLKPGGVALHMDGAYTRWKGKSPFEQYESDWSTHYNAEPFAGKLGDTDLKAAMVDAGFAPAKVAVCTAPNGYAVIVDAEK